VDDFQYVPGQAAESDGLALAPNGTLFASGSGADSSGVRHGLVMASANVGITWSGLLDDFVYPGTHTTLYNAGMVADSAGNLYVAGTAYDDGTPSGGPNHWIVRRSTDNGATWSTVDDFAPGGFLTQPNGIGADAAGNIYVAGDADYVNPYDTTYWTIRKGVGGTNFTTVDSISSGSSGNTAMAVFAHPTAGLFAVGRAPVALTGKQFFGRSALEWTVRRSTNGGATWSTVDTFAFSSSSSVYGSQANGIGADALGNLYVVGQAGAPNKPNGSGYLHWVVRKSTNGGSTWTTVDNYQLSSTDYSQATAFAADSKGNLYVAGWGFANNGAANWIVRWNPVGTSTWSTADDYTYAPGGSAWAFTMAANASGNVFVGGGGSGTSEHWVVRKR